MYVTMGVPTQIHIIAAVAENGVIGDKGGMPWPTDKEDMKWFKRITIGYPIIMGRKTWESLPKKPLPNRRNIVVTHDRDYVADGAEVVHSLDEAYWAARGAFRAFVIGGESLYRQALPYADIMFITLKKGKPKGDTKFPWDAYDDQNWHIQKGGTDTLELEVHYRDNAAVLRPS